MLYSVELFVEQVMQCSCTQLLHSDTSEIFHPLLHNVWLAYFAPVRKNICSVGNKNFSSRETGGGAPSPTGKNKLDTASGRVQVPSNPA